MENNIKSFGVGLQLYTIRDAMERDPLDSLRRVSDMGFKYLELAGYADGLFYGFAPSEFKKIVDDLGMEIISSHAMAETSGIVSGDVEEIAADHAVLDVKYCIHPWIFESDRTTLEGYKKLTAKWNLAGTIMKQYHIQFGYHNHNFEFDSLGGKIPYYDILMAELDTDLVTMELDLFWAVKAGQNPVEIFRKYPGRFQLFHLKDMFTHETPFFNPVTNDFAPVGAGVLDFAKILASKEVAGLKYLFVEQDSTKDGKPFDAIKTSITNLTTQIMLNQK